MAITATIGLFCLLLVSISAYAYRLYSRPRFEERLGAAVADEHKTEGSSPGGRQWVVRVVEQIGEKVQVSPQDASMARRYLLAAGYRSQSAIQVYYGTKIVMAVAGLIVGLVLRTHLSNPVSSIVVVVAGAAAGFFGPNMILERMVGARQERLRLSLPDALDLMVVCMEAGLGLDKAIASVAQELQVTHKDISDELSLVNLEMRAGKRRVEALRNLSDRTGEPELRKLVATIIQADRFGTGVAESLRTHSEFMRVRRRQDAEERAAKVGVKLVFPIFFFILPSMLVVAAGPGLLQLFKNLFPMMKSFGG